MATSHGRRRPLLKDLNERTVLDAIRAPAPISRAEISRRVGISKPTVSLALQSLLQAGLVRETAHDPAPARATARSSSSRPGGGVRARPRSRRALPARRDLRPRTARSAPARTSSSSEADAAAALEAIDGSRGRCSTQAGSVARSSSTASCSACPAPSHGLADQARDERRRPRGPRLRRPAVGPARTDRLTLENDINLAALGERWRGVARGVDDFVFLSIGTGLGAGPRAPRRAAPRRTPARPASSTTLRVGHDEEDDPCAGAVPRALALLRAADRHRRRRTIHARSSPPRAAATRCAGGRGRGARGGSRCISAPIAAVTDVGLVVLGGGIGANARPGSAIRALLAGWLPYSARSSRSRASAMPPC